MLSAAKGLMDSMSIDKEKQRSAHGASPAEGLSRRILSALKPFTGEDTNRWLAQLGEDPSLALAAQAPPKSRVKNAQLTLNTLDMMFDNFQRYAFEFNKNAAGTNLQIGCERPSKLKHKMDNFGNVKEISQGYISTRFWTMVIAAEEERIGVFIVPIEFQVGFNPYTASFLPVMDLRMAAACEERYWVAADETITFQHIHFLARRLFSTLVKVASGEVNPYQGVSLRERTAPVAATQQLPPKPMGEHELLKAPPQNYSVEQGSFSKTSQTSQAMPAPAVSQPAQSTSNPQVNHAEQFSTGAHEQLRRQHGAPVRGPEAMEKINQELQESDQRIGEAWENLLVGIDREFDKLANIGVKAMHGHDMTNVVRVMNRTAQLRSLIEKAAALSDEWYAFIGTESPDK